MLAALTLLAAETAFGGDPACAVWLSIEVTSASSVHVRAEATIEAPANAVLDALEDFDHFAEYMPRVRRTAREPGGSVYTEIDSPWPLPNIWFVSEFTREEVAGGWLLKWRMLRGNIRENTGAWWVSALPGERTRLRYEGDVALFSAIPPALLRSVEQHEMPRLVQAVRARAARGAPLICKETVTQRFE